MKEEVILGIDPGTNILGYGIIKAKGNKIELLSMGVIKLDHYNTHHEKLMHIFTRTNTLIDQHRPTHVAIEAPFFGKNVQSMLKLGRAQGVAITSAMVNSIEVTEYSPKEIKQSVTGNGNASKQQVAAMLSHLLSIKQQPKFLDATDALAAAVTFHIKSGSIGIKNDVYKDWKDYIKKNSLP